MKRILTEEQRAARREYHRAYAAAHKRPATEAERATKREYNRAYYAANKQQFRKYGKAWKEANPEKAKAFQRAYKEANRPKVRLAGREYYARTKVTRAEAMRENWTKQNRKRPALWLAKCEALLGRQKPDACDACGGSDGGIVFDHCHDKGHPRGWLCDRCNIALGCLKDDRDRLRKLIAYLDRTAAGTGPQMALSGL
jgi:hypothetical protein